MNSKFKATARVKIAKIIMSDGSVNPDSQKHMLGKSGTVVHTHPVERFGLPQYINYNVRIDGEERVLSFVEEELE